MIEEVRRTFKSCKSQTYTEYIESNILLFSLISLRRQPLFLFCTVFKTNMNGGMSEE